jgi:hypothetical protein
MLKLYKNLKLKLQNLQISLPKFSTETQQFNQDFTEVQILIENEILNLESSQLNDKISPQWQSIQTEIYRGYRLLMTDILFLKTARKPDMIDTRLNTIQQRLNQLISYCDAIAKCYE